jgi:hypothetical protein
VSWTDARADVGQRQLMSSLLAANLAAKFDRLTGVRGLGVGRSEAGPRTTKLLRVGEHIGVSSRPDPDSDDLADEFVRRATEVMSSAGWEPEPDAGPRLGRRHRPGGLGRFCKPVGGGFVARVLFDSTGPPDDEQDGAGFGVTFDVGVGYLPLDRLRWVLTGEQSAAAGSVHNVDDLLDPATANPQ